MVHRWGAARTTADTIERYGELADQGDAPADVAKRWSDAGLATRRPRAGSTRGASTPGGAGPRRPRRDPDAGGEEDARRRRRALHRHDRLQGLQGPPVRAPGRGAGGLPHDERRRGLPAPASQHAALLGLRPRLVRGRAAPPEYADAQGEVDGRRARTSCARCACRSAAAVLPRRTTAKASRTGRSRRAGRASEDEERLQDHHGAGR